MWKFSRPLLVLALAAALAACESDPIAVADSDPHVIGVITRVRLGGSALPAKLLVEDLVVPDLPPSTPSDSAYAWKLWLDVGPGTPIFVENTDGSMRKGDISDLTVGASIRAWVWDFVRTSLPPQYAATRIEVVNAE
jgi:hypothetical protein